MEEAVPMINSKLMKMNKL